MKPGNTSRRSAAALPLRLAASAMLLGLVATGLAGCDSSRVSDEMHPRLSDPVRRHPIAMVAETATLDIVLPPTSKGNEARAYVETTRFVRNFRREGSGPLRIAVPRGAGGRAEQRVQAVRLAAYRAGIPSQRVRVERKASGPDAVTLSYDRIAAVGPTCGEWGEDVTRNPHNLPFPNFGCATQRNLAAMAANPTDLMYPANETPRGSGTRAQENKNFNQNIGKMIPGGAGSIGR